jgi:hypothetical protein
MKKQPCSNAGVGRSFFTRFLPALMAVVVLFACSAEDPVEIVENSPPSKPSDPVPPSDTLQRQPVSVQLAWTCSDPDGGPMRYEIHFGTSNPPSVVDTVDTNAYSPPSLQYSRTYFWQVVAKDNVNLTATGDVWAFKTVDNGAPPPPSYVSPANGADDRSVHSQLQWSASIDPESDPVTYDVYLGTTNPPSLALADRSATSYNPGELLYDQTYYWRISAKDNRSNESPGPVWSFTTVENLPPAVASNPDPPNGAGDLDPSSVVISFDSSDPENDPMTYNVYFGTASNPPLVASGFNGTSYPLGQLAYGQTYYWKIDCLDDYSNTTPGIVWHLKTIAGVWTVQSTPTSASLQDVWGTSDTDVFAVGGSGAVLHYNGTSWSNMPKPSSANSVWFYGVRGTSSTNVTAVGHTGTLGYIMYYNGSDWIRQTIDPSPGLNEVWFHSSGNRYLVGNNGLIADVDYMDSGTTENLYIIWGTSLTNIYVGGNAGTLLRYNGSAWSPMTSGTSYRIYDIWGTSASNVYAVGYRTHLKYDGSSWVPDLPLQYEDLRGVWGASANDVFVAGTSGVIFHYDGANWNSMDSGTSESLYGGVWGTSGSSVWAVGNGGTILHFGPP